MLTAVGLAAVLGLTAAACGDDDDDAGGESPAPAATTAAGGEDTATTQAAETTEAAATTDGGDDASSTTASGSPGGGGGDVEVDCASGADESLDAEYGTGAGWLAWAIACGNEAPMKAEGDPIVLGIQNPEGDPAGSFPEFTVGFRAAVDYINNELGGIGADYEAGTPGRPIQLEVCNMAIAPADSQRCANELASKDVFVAVSSINFFGNHFPVLTGAGIPSVVTSPVTAADFTTEGVYAIGGGGGCLGQHTGLVEFVTNDLGKRKIAVPWADTPPGVFCYHDLEKKPLNVLNGTTESTSSAAGTMPELTHIGVPIKPGQADMTAQITQVLDFEPDGIIFSAQGADCWTLVATLARLGWSADEIPLVLSGACIDTAAAMEAGEAAEGIYFVGSPIQEPSALQGMQKLEGMTLLEKADAYGGAEAVTKGFGANGFVSAMFIWQMMSEASEGDPASLTREAFTEAMAATSEHHAFGNTPMSCADAIEPYTSVCNSLSTVTQWDGENYIPQRENFSGVYLIEGTELDFGN